MLIHKTKSNNKKILSFKLRLIKVNQKFLFKRGNSLSLTNKLKYIPVIKMPGMKKKLHYKHRYNRLKRQRSLMKKKLDK